MGSIAWARHAEITLVSPACKKRAERWEERSVCSVLGAGGLRALSEAKVEELEHHIDALEKELPPLRRFILPGGSPAAAAFHVARTVCRRAERRAVELHRSEPLGAASLRYLNRLSDLLFVMARVENHRAGVADVEWEGRERS